MHSMSRPPQGPQSQIVCGGCRTLLMYPQGAQNVRCARCSHITSVSPPVPNSDMAQLCCHNPHCRVQLMYPRGALQVQCSLCGTLNDAQQANQLGHVVCGGCQITLMYAHGAQSVKCAACNHVTQVARPGGVRPPPHQHHVYQTQTSQQAQQQLPQSSSAPPEAAHSQQISNPPAKPVQAVLVENPPTLDDGGNEVHNVSLGLARNGDRIQSEAK